MSLFLTQVSPLLLILGDSDLDEVVGVGGALCATRRPLSLAGLVLLVFLHVKELEKTRVYVTLSHSGHWSTNSRNITMSMSYTGFGR